MSGTSWRRRRVHLVRNVPAEVSKGQAEAHWRRTWSTNPIERLDREVERRTVPREREVPPVVGILPRPTTVSRLAGCVLIEAPDEWAVTGRRYLSEASMALLTPPEPTALPGHHAGTSTDTDTTVDSLTARTAQSEPQRFTRAQLHHSAHVIVLGCSKSSRGVLGDACGVEPVAATEPLRKDSPARTSDAVGWGKGIPQGLPSTRSSTWRPAPSLTSPGSILNSGFTSEDFSPVTTGRRFRPRLRSPRRTKRAGGPATRVCPMVGRRSGRRSTSRRSRMPARSASAGRRASGRVGASSGWVSHGPSGTSTGTGSRPGVERCATGVLGLGNLLLARLRHEHAARVRESEAVARAGEEDGTNASPPVPQALSDEARTWAPGPSSCSTLRPPRRRRPPSARQLSPVVRRQTRAPRAVGAVAQEHVRARLRVRPPKGGRSPRCT